MGRPALSRGARPAPAPSAAGRDESRGCSSATLPATELSPRTLPKPQAMPPASPLAQPPQPHLLRLSAVPQPGMGRT